MSREIISGRTCAPRARPKAISKIFQTNGLLFSDVTLGLEESMANLRKLQQKPGKWLSVFNSDFNPSSQTFDGHELNSVSEGTAVFERDSKTLLTSMIKCTADRFEPLLSDPILCLGLYHFREPQVATLRQS